MEEESKKEKKREKTPQKESKPIPLDFFKTEESRGTNLSNTFFLLHLLPINKLFMLLTEDTVLYEADATNVLEEATQGTITFLCHLSLTVVSWTRFITTQNQHPISVLRIQHGSWVSNWFLFWHWNNSIEFLIQWQMTHTYLSGILPQAYSSH